MTNLRSDSSTEVQENPDAWAYAALGEPVPDPKNGSAPASNSDATGDQNGGSGVTAFRSGEGDNPPSPGPAPESAPPQLVDLASLTLDEALKHPAFGPLLNGWNDKTTNSRLQSERPKIEQELRPVISAEVERNETRQYLDGLDDAERGRVLGSNPDLAVVWSDYQKERQQVTATPEQLARSAQVYGLATQITMIDQVIDDSGLPSDLAEKLKDTSGYAEKGPAGIVEWGKEVNRQIIEYHKEAGIKAEIETRWQSEQEVLKGQQPARPRIQPPGSKVPPMPDMIEGSNQEFLDAFKT